MKQRCVLDLTTVGRLRGFTRGRAGARGGVLGRGAAVVVVVAGCGDLPPIWKVLPFHEPLGAEPITTVRGSVVVVVVITVAGLIRSVAITPPMTTGNRLIVVTVGGAFARATGGRSCPWAHPGVPVPIAPCALSRHTGTHRHGRHAVPEARFSHGLATATPVQVSMRSTRCEKWWDFRPD